MNFYTNFLIKLKFDFSHAHYLLARALAKQERYEEALSQLNVAEEQGFKFNRQIAHIHEFKSINTKAEFIALYE